MFPIRFKVGYVIIVCIFVPFAYKTKFPTDLSKQRKLTVCKWIEWKKSCEETPISATPTSLPKNGIHSHISGGVSSVKCFKPPAPSISDQKPYFLSVGLVVRRESDFIEEWARHYVGEGVEHFFIIDQESVVDYRVKNSPTIERLGMTAAVIERALPNMTTHIPTPPLASQLESQKAVQFAANRNIQGHLSIANMPNMKSSYISIVNAARHLTAWILMVDSDEFLFASSPHLSAAAELRKLIESTPNVGQVSVPWIVFGSSDHIPMPKCILSSFTMRFPYDFQYNEDDDGGGNVGARKIHHIQQHTQHDEEDAHIKAEVEFQLNQAHEVNGEDPFASILGSKPPNTTTIVRRQRRRRRLITELPLKGRRKAFGIGLVKSMVRIDALPFRNWDPTVTGSVHAQRPCPGWTTLSADGRPKGLFVPNAVKAGGRPNLKPSEWVMHDWVRIDTALFRLHHYKFRSKDWMLKVKACRGLDLTGTDVELPDGTALLDHLEKEDTKAYVCDSTLASRQAFGPGTMPGVGPGVRGACGNWAYHGSSTSPNNAVQKKDWLNLIGGRSSFSVDSYVDLGPGCGVGAVFTHTTNPIVNVPKCEKYQEDPLVVDYSDPSLHGGSLDDSTDKSQNEHSVKKHSVNPRKVIMNHHFP